MSTNWSRRKERERGFPRFCKKCGAGFVIYTSKTTKNPGRLFHGCPNGSEEVKKNIVSVPWLSDLSWFYLAKVNDFLV